MLVIPFGHVMPGEVYEKLCEIKRVSKLVRELKEKRVAT